MKNTEYQWFNVIKRNIDLIEDSSIFAIENPFEDPELNYLHGRLKSYIGAKELKTALKLSLSDLLVRYPQSQLRQYLQGSKGVVMDFKSYEEQLFDKYAKRELTTLGDKLVYSSQGGEDAQVLINESKTFLDSLDGCVSSDADMTKEKSYEILIKKIKDMQNPSPDNFIKMGIESIDKKIVGLQRKKHIIIGARPSIGKTAAGMTLAINAKRQGKKVLFLTVEMTVDQIFARACYNNGNIEGSIFNPGEPTQATHFDALNQSADELIRDDNIIFINPTRRTITDVARSIRKCKRENPDLSMVIVDYLQKIEGSDRRASPVEQIKEVSGVLTDLCKSLDVVMVTLAQLNRDADENAIPQLKHLKGSSDIEQDADLIFLLHRSREAQKDAQANGSTNKPVLPKGVESEPQTLNGLQSLWDMVKNRDGATGSFITYYDAPVMRFNSEPNGVYIPSFGGEDSF